MLSSNLCMKLLLTRKMAICHFRAVGARLISLLRPILRSFDFCKQIVHPLIAYDHEKRANENANFIKILQKTNERYTEFLTKELRVVYNSFSEFKG